MNAQTPRPVDLPRTDNWDEAKIIAGPSTLAERAQWRSKLIDWRKDAAIRLNYDDSAYQSAELFNNPSYNVALIWLWDELLFDYSTQQFTPDKLLADAQKFGAQSLLYAVPRQFAQPVPTAVATTVFSACCRAADDEFAAGVDHSEGSRLGLAGYADQGGHYGMRGEWSGGSNGS